MRSNGKQIGAAVCPDCHVEVGGILDTPVGELLVLIGPPLKMPNRDRTRETEGRLAPIVHERSVAGAVVISDWWVA